jgi:hypothetical protein
MKRFALIVFTFLPAFSVLSFAQDISGIWRGYFITDKGGQYRFEVQIEHTRNNTLSGVTYSYQDKRFYGKSAMTGNFSKASGNALIQEIKTIEIKIEGISTYKTPWIAFSPIGDVLAISADGSVYFYAVQP